MDYIFITGNSIFFWLNVFFGIFSAYYLIKGIKKHSLPTVTILLTLFLMGCFNFFGPSEDNFADELTIPDNMEISKPEESQANEEAKTGDGFQSALLESLRIQGNSNPTVTADIGTLVELHKLNSDILMRYLASSPSWRVFGEHGKLFATRRLKIGTKWKYDLHGYYSKSDITKKSDIENFQFRVTIGLNGTSWAGFPKDATKLASGKTEKLKITTRNGMFQSLAVITDWNLAVEIFEQSTTKERRLTKTALTHIENELSPLLSEPSFETIKKILPTDGITTGELSFGLNGNLGIYDSYIRVNPGEPGMIYLKAFEVTTNTPLSISRLKEKSNEFIGWSDNPNELFLSNTNFTIYEGDWGDKYAARFEVWFAPSSGGDERKLMEKTFEIEGWER